ncbi:unnamed protein product [Pedinophyceae sp. YPF-701]|nr:unnamed protein product [Pedinophyceae sp. YPF-701]
MSDTVDLLGFPVKQLTEEEVNARRRAASEENAPARLKWWTKQAPKVKPGVTPKGKLKRMIRGGIPHELRPTVWPRLAGVDAKREKLGANYYSKLVKKISKVPHAVKTQIDMDIHRTFPGHPLIKSPRGADAMRRILLAYALHNPQVGYTQGMNYVAGFLLIVLGGTDGDRLASGGEETAFMILLCVIDDILHSELFGDDLIGLHIEMAVLRALVSMRAPRVATVFERLQVPISVVCTEWFLGMFTRAMPSETVARIWDSVLSEGVKVVFRFSLGLLLTSEPRLLPCVHVGQVIQVMRTRCERMHDRQRLVKAAFDVKLKRDEISKLRVSKGEEVRDQISKNAGSRLGKQMARITGAMNVQDSPDRNRLDLAVNGMAPALGAQSNRETENASQGEPGHSIAKKSMGGQSSRKGAAIARVSSKGGAIARVSSSKGAVSGKNTPRAPSAPRSRGTSAGVPQRS